VKPITKLFVISTILVAASIARAGELQQCFLSASHGGYAVMVLPKDAAPNRAARFVYSFQSFEEKHAGEPSTLNVTIPEQRAAQKAARLLSQLVDNHFCEAREVTATCSVEKADDAFTIYLNNQNDVQTFADEGDAQYMKNYLVDLNFCK